MKRAFDVALSLVVLVIAAPFVGVAAALIWFEDRAGPFYTSGRVGLHEEMFRMVKLRSMVVDADKSGVDSTGGSDARITRVGRWLRMVKLDELPQFWNVLKGDMSLVGPRPNVPREVVLYTDEEHRLLEVRPGITDLASIVFADESEILDGQEDPDVAYNQLIRPWKSRLGLFYVDHRSLALDLRLLWLTVVAMVSRNRALKRSAEIVTRRGGPPEVAQIALRAAPLVPHPPPGADLIVTSRSPATSEPA